LYLDLQKLRHTLLATGIDFCIKYRDTARVASSGNVYSLNRRAVSVNKASYILTVSMLDTMRVLYKKGLRSSVGTETLSPRDRFARTARLHMAIHGFVLKKNIQNRTMSTICKRLP